MFVNYLGTESTLLLSSGINKMRLELEKQKDVIDTTSCSKPVFISYMSTIGKQIQIVLGFQVLISLSNSLFNLLFLVPISKFQIQLA